MELALDPRTAFMVLVFAAVFTAAQAALGLLRAGVTKRVVNRRLATAERAGSLGELVLELRKQRGLKEGQDGKRGYLGALIMRAGVRYEPRKWALYIAVLGVVVTAVVFILSRHAFLALGLGAAAAGGLPLLALNMIAKRRAKALGEQLPGALEVVVRSLEAGHPVPTAIALVGREMPDPIGSEFGMAADEIAYGSTLEQAVGNIADRCLHPDFDLFAATIRLQERAGGNLVGLLKMNAQTVRERQKMRMKVQAASSEGRASAMILTAAPIVVMLLLQVMRPAFYGDVIGEPVVQMWLAGFGVWMAIGNLVMRRMIDMRI